MQRQVRIGLTAPGRSYDDMKPDIEAMTFLSDQDRVSIFEGNARRLFKNLPG